MTTPLEKLRRELLLMRMLDLAAADHRNDGTWDRTAALARQYGTPFRVTAGELERLRNMTVGEIYASPDKAPARCLQCRQPDHDGACPDRGTSKHHVGMAAHDGYAPHSHQIRPDHKSVARTKPGEADDPDRVTICRNDLVNLVAWLRELLAGGPAESFPQALLRRAQENLSSSAGQRGGQR